MSSFLLFGLVFKLSIGGFSHLDRLAQLPPVLWLQSANIVNRVGTKVEHGVTSKRLKVLNICLATAQHLGNFIVDAGGDWGDDGKCRLLFLYYRKPSAGNRHTIRSRGSNNARRSRTNHSSTTDTTEVTSPIEEECHNTSK